MKNTIFTLTSIATLTVSVNAQVTADSVSTAMAGGSISAIIDNNYNVGWTQNPEQTGSITFGFNSAVDLYQFNLWDDVRTPANKQGIESFTLTFFSGITNLGTESLVSADLTPGSTHLGATLAATSMESYRFSTYTAVDTVVLEVTSATGGHGGFQQIREANFNTVPEPSSTALLGLGALGLLARRKR